MSLFQRWSRALLVALVVLASGVGCQAVFGGFRIDDNAFLASMGAAGGGQSGPIRLKPTEGLYTTEWGGQATFYIVLTHQPTSPVTIGLSSSNPGEGKVSPASITFTAVDWRAPQRITVTGVPDGLRDGNQTYQIRTAPAVSDDSTFSGIDAADVTLVNIDAQTAGVTIAPVSGLVTSESGAQDTFTVVLNSPPAKNTNVTIGLSSSNPKEGTVAPDSLVFTDVNWMAPQLVTVTGIPDGAKDGPQVFKILTAATVSTDPAYVGIDPQDVEVTNQDNDTAGLTVALVTGVDPVDPTLLRTSEGGDTATFTVALNVKPSADVTVAVASSLPSEGTISPPSLTFTQANWNAPQTVTVTGANDAVADGDQPYSVVVGPPTGDDADYAALMPVEVPAVNVDNDKPGFTLMLVSGIDPNDATKLLTTEAGTTATFTLALNSEPMSDVTVTVSSTSTTNEAAVSPGSLTFTRQNWQAPQLVTVTGLNDEVQDGSQQFRIQTDPAESEDPGYSKLDPPDVQVINQDDDSAGYRITLAMGIDPGKPNALVTGENGDTASFQLALTSKPTASVSVSLSSSNPNEGILSQTLLTFTPENYRAPQTVYVNGKDDLVVDGNQAYAIQIGAASSMDPNFNTKFATQIPVTNRDNDTAGVIVTPVSGLTTTEGGGTATFKIQLQSQPAAGTTVTIGIHSNNTLEGTTNVNSVTFTPANWNAPQTVTVTGQNDDVADGNASYKIVIDPPMSADPNYGPTRLDPPDVSVTNLDNDSAGIIVKPTSGLVTTEAGGTATFTIALQSQPVAMVKINLSSTRPTEGTVGPPSVTFTAANWKAPQIVTVTGVNDDIADGPQPYLIQMALASSTDGKYNGLQGASVSVTNTDNDSAGVNIVQAPSLQTKENGLTATFTVALRSQPTASVTIALASSNTAEGTVSPPSLVFTAANWAMPQTVTITGVDDSVADGPQPYTVNVGNAKSTDASYSGLFGSVISVTNLDNDQAGFSVVAGSDLHTTEKGGVATFTVALLSMPTKSVTLPLMSSNTAEGTVSPPSLLFTTSNWAMPQTVTVTGVDDSIRDGNQVYAVQFSAAMSQDPGYGSTFPSAVSLTNDDDDKASVLVTPTSCATTPGTTATFTVVLTSKPTAPVTIPLSSDNEMEGTVSPATLTFKPGDWNMAQTVTVTGIDDMTMGAMTSYQIVTGVTTTTDTSGYAAYNPADVSCVNTTPAPMPMP